VASKRDTLIASAEKSVQKGKIDAALKDYLKVLEETPADINVLNKVGDLFVRLNRNDEALPYFTKIAEHYSRDGFFLKAIAIYKRINKIDPARLEVYERLAELYAKQGLGMEAKSQYQVLADYYTKQGNVNLALGIYQKMVLSEPSNIQLHVKLADLFTQARKVPDALKEYGVVAGMLRDRGAYEESIQVYDKALKIAPDNIEILKTFVPLLLGAGRIEEARAVLRKALETTPRSVPLFLMAADAAFTANDMADARSYVSKAQAVDPENEDVLGMVVKIQLKGRRPDLAFSAAAPLADMAVRRGEAKKALALLTPIAKADPENEDVLKKIVEIAKAAGDEGASIPYRSALAEIWRRQGKSVEAAEALRILTRLAPDVADFRARLTQLEPLLPASPVGTRAPEATNEPREITLSGVVSAPTKQPAPAPAPAPVEPSAPPRTAPVSDTFEFELSDDELTDQAPAPIAEPVPAAPVQFAPTGPGPGIGSSEPPRIEMPVVSPPEPPRPPPLALNMFPNREETDPGLGSRMRMPDAISEPAPSVSFESEGAGWEGFESRNLTAAEAMEEFEARQAKEVLETPFEAPVQPAAEFEEAEEIVELQAGAEIPSEPEILSEAAEEVELTGGYRARPITPTDRSGFLHRVTPSSSFGSPADDLSFVSMAGVPIEDTPSAVPALSDSVAKAAPSAPAAMGPDAEEVLVEAEVFRKYGLLDKAIDQLKSFSRVRPDVLRVREKLFELYLEQGKKNSARREAEYLRQRYTEEGREDRVRAIDALVGGAVVASQPSATAPPLLVTAPPTRSASGTFKRVSAADIEIPLASVSRKPKAPEPAPPPVPEIPPPAPVPESPSAVSAPPPAEAEEVESVSFEAEPASTNAPSLAADSFPLDDLGAIDLGPSAPPGQVPPPAWSPGARGDLLEEEQPPEEALQPVEPLLPPRRPAAESAPIDLDLVEFAPAEPVALEPELVAGEAISREPTVADVPPVAVEPASPVAFAEQVEPSPVDEPTPEQLAEVDFCLDQGMVVDAAERLQSLEGRFPGHEEIRARRSRLEGARGSSIEGGAALEDLLSEDLESVLDAELERALTDEMTKSSEGTSPKMAAPPRQPTPSEAAVVDESGLFSDEDEFFNFAEELQTELKQDAALPSQPEMGGPNGEVSLEEIFREFKKGVEQQLSPEDFETHYNLGIAYKEMALTDEAIGEFQLASKDPAHAVECCSMLGLCFLEKGLPQLAIKWYKKGLDTATIHEEDRLGLLYDLANVYSDVGDRENAYKSFLEIYGSNASYRDAGERLKELSPA
jgi:tetratricopeptide (TPR) repeat protein